MWQPEPIQVMRETVCMYVCMDRCAQSILNNTVHCHIHLGQLSVDHNSAPVLISNLLAHHPTEQRLVNSPLPSNAAAFNRAMLLIFRIAQCSFHKPQQKRLKVLFIKTFHPLTPNRFDKQQQYSSRQIRSGIVPSAGCQCLPSQAEKAFSFHCF